MKYLLDQGSEMANPEKKLSWIPESKKHLITSVSDPEVFGPPGSESVCQRYTVDPDSDPDPSKIKQK
jgi:hypothetical protein